MGDGENIIFGFPISNDEMKILNILIVYCKYYIYKSKIINEVKPEFLIYLIKLKTFLIIEATINKENSREYEDLEHVITWL